MCLVTLSLLTLPQGAEANQVTEKKEAVVHKGGMGFEARIGVGYLQGEANEWVYNPEQSRPESKLTWTLDPVLMAGVGMTVRPLAWLELNADVWTKVSDSSEMDDWDWVYESSEPRPEWTDWSHHEETSVEDGLIIDLNASVSVYKTQHLTVHGIIGYLHDHWSWDATKGGTYIYSTDASNGEFRDDIGTFPLDGTGITYEQTFDTPYLGIGIGARFNPVTIKAKVIGSTLVSGEDYDHHSATSTKYYQDYRGENMIGLTG
ncbi:MAG: omptin family outer membrane protease, partial [Candidatus Electrothrix sp. AUS4]|nr:omptin family outer membrane protease [Candidatus Electrothrix sp. AUS4]